MALPHGPACYSHCSLLLLLAGPARDVRDCQSSIVRTYLELGRLEAKGDK